MTERGNYIRDNIFDGNNVRTKRTLILSGFIALKFLLQFLLLSSGYDLHRDEYLHLDQANHLAWGYLSVPPFTSWTSYIIQLLGNSVFWVKFFPAFYGALTIYIVWKAIEELGGGWFASVLGATCVLFSALLRINTLYQPNSFDVLSWATFYYMLVKYARTENSKWLFASAVVFAVGFLNKYNVLFQLIGVIPALLLGGHRKLFAQSKLYTAAAIGFLIILPNLFWQYRNGFPVFHHLQELSETQLVNASRLDFIKSQFLFFVGGIFVLVAALYALWFYKPFRPYRFFFWALLFTLTVFMYFRAKAYYAIGIYPVYIAFGSVYLEAVLKMGWKKYLQPVLIVIPFVVFIPVLKVAFPNKSPAYIIRHSEDYQKFGLLRWEDGKDHLIPQDFADMLGWKELARKADSVYAGLPNKHSTLVLCDNYGQAGAINYYSKQGIKAVSFNADYLNWFDLSKRYENLIRVKSAGDIDTELQGTAPFFETSKIADSVTNQYAREHGTAVFSFAGAKIDIRERIKDEIDKNKSRR